MNKKLMIKVLKELENEYPGTYKIKDLIEKLKIPFDDEFFKIISYLVDSKKIKSTHYKRYPKKDINKTIVSISINDYVQLKPEGVEFLNREITRKTQEDLRYATYLFTIVLAGAAIGSFYVSYTTMTPKLFGPVFSCPTSIGGDINDSTSLVVTFGNYGDVPTVMTFNWQGNNIEGYNTYSENEIKRGLLRTFSLTSLYVPIKYQDNKQSSFYVFMKIENKNITTADFSLKWFEYNNFFSFVFPVTVKCDYEKIDENFILK